MAIRVGLGISTDKDPLQAAKEASRNAKIQLGEEKIDFAVVFSTIEFSHLTVLQTIRSIIGDCALIGSSSFGLITNQGVFKSGLLVALFSLPANTHVNLACLKQIGSRSGPSIGRDLADKLSYGFSDIPRHVGVLFPDGLLHGVSSILEGLQERFGKSFPVIGGSSSDDLSFKKTFQYFDREVLSESISAMLWGGRLNFGFGIHHGWKPLGKPRYVTKSFGNAVLEIDGIPAVSIYREYFASDIEKLRHELKRISILYPIGIFIPGEEEYLLRNLLSIENNGALVFQGDVPKNSQIRLMIGTKESCLSATSQAIDAAKKGLADRPCNFVFVFDSVSRYKLLGRQADTEVEIIKERLGPEVPIIGMYTYGEQAPLEAIRYHGLTYFHNQSIAALAIGA